MISLTNHIKVKIIRNASGRAEQAIGAGCRSRALTHPAFSNISYKLPSSCSSNEQVLYDPEQPSKIINIMNFFRAPSTSYLAFLGSDFNNAVDPQCELEAGDELTLIWIPILGEKLRGFRGFNG